MSWSRIKGILAQEAYVTKHEGTIWFDLVVVSVMSMLIFGFMSKYLSKSNPLAGNYIVLGMILWEIVRVNQYCVSVNSLWNIWSQNLSNIFVSPISILEFVVGNCLLAFVKTTVVVVAVAVIGGLAFNFNVLHLGITLPVAFVIMTLFAWALGFVLLGIIFRYGVTMQSLAWGAIFFVQPLSAVYFPVSVLPQVVQWVCWLFPSTYAFEAARHSLNGPTDWSLLAGGAALDSVWFVGGFKAFAMLFHRSRVVGQFARNDT